MMRVRRPSAKSRTLTAGGELPTPIEVLRGDLQFAIELEHATIPPYLTALYSILEGTNDAIRGILRSVVLQEMLHMAMAGNILAAIGGKPDLTKPDFLPVYPTDLPFDIGGLLHLVAPAAKIIVVELSNTEQANTNYADTVASAGTRTNNATFWSSIGRIYP